MLNTTQRVPIEALRKVDNPTDLAVALCRKAVVIGLSGGDGHAALAEAVALADETGITAPTSEIRHRIRMTQEKLQALHAGAR